MTDTTDQTTPAVNPPAPNTDPLAGTSLPAAASTVPSQPVAATIGDGSKHDSIIAHLMDKFKGDIEAAEAWVKTELAKI